MSGEFIDFSEFNRNMEKSISEYALRRAFLVGLVAAGTGACYVLNRNNGEVPLAPTGTKEPTTHPNPLETLAAVEKIGPWEIAASGVGYVEGLTKVDGDSTYEDLIAKQAAKAIGESTPNFDPNRVHVYNYQMKGEKGNAPFPLIVIDDGKNPESVESVFVGFAIDEYGVLVPPYEGEDLTVLLKLNVVTNDEGKTQIIGAEDINDSEAIYIPGFFVMHENGNTEFVNPYTDGFSFNKSVPIEGEFKVGQAMVAKPEIEIPVKEFPICTIEKFKDCVITEQELFDGTYLRWLQTQSKPFDPAVVKDVPFDVLPVPGDPTIVYDLKTAPNFADPTSRPFRRDVTVGVVNVQVDANNIAIYVVKPIEFFDKNDPKNNKWVITVESYYAGNNPMTGVYDPIPDVENWININNKVWKNDMNITPIRMTSKTSMTDIPDPLTLKTFAAFPDMQERFNKFLAGDVSALSQKGIVLNTSSAKMTGGLLK